MIKNGILHVHSMYSLHDSTQSPEDIVRWASEHGCKNITLLLYERPYSVTGTIKLTGLKEAPKDICKAKIIGTWKAVNAAYSQLGVNYVWGGTTPNVGLDCSGLTQYCYSQAGISIPRTSQEQSEKGKVVTNPEPGDICVSNNAGHVAIYIGNGQMIEAPDVGQQVKVSAVRAEKFVRFY